MYQQLFRQHSLAGQAVEATNVNVQIGSDTMTCTVTIVQTLLLYVFVSLVLLVRKNVRYHTQRN